MSKDKKNPAKVLAFMLLLAIIVLSLIGGGSLAYKAHEEHAHGVVSAGTIEIDLHCLDKNNKEFPTNGYQNVVPGAKITNTVYVENTCDYDEYIRIKLDSVFISQTGQPLDLTKVSLNINEDMWTYKDGYYYYNKILAKRQVTDHLFTTVSFDCSLDNAVRNAKFDIDITAEAVQAKNNGDSPLTALGWQVIDTY